jgi:hypothetical protein
MPSYALHPLFAGQVLRLDPGPTRQLAHPADGEPDRLISTIAPLSTLPSEELAGVIDQLQRSGGSLEDSEVSFTR